MSENFKELTKTIFENCENPMDEEAVLSEMFSQGIPFGKLKTLYKTVGISEGFLADPKVVFEAINESLESYADELQEASDWSDVEVVVDTILKEVDGSTDAVVLRAVRAFCKDQDIELPKKTKGTGIRKRGGALAEAVITYANKTEGPSMTQTGFFDAVLPAVKGPQNAAYYVGAYFPMIYAVKNGCTLAEANKAMASMEKVKAE